MSKSKHNGLKILVTKWKKYTLEQNGVYFRHLENTLFLWLLRDEDREEKSVYILTLSPLTTWLSFVFQKMFLKKR